MYALIYNDIHSCMLEPLPDHQEMAGYAPAPQAVGVHKIISLTDLINYLQ